MSLRAANEYAFVNARIRGLKAQLISVGDYERMLQSDSYEEFMKLLMSTHYGNIINKEHPVEAPTPGELALVLSKDFADVTYKLSRSLTGKVREFTQSYMKMFLAESLKTIVRGIHVELDPEEILRFTVPTSPEQSETFSALVQFDSVQKMIEALPYWDAKIALLTKLPLYEDYQSTAPLEVALEEWFLRGLEESLEQFSDEDKRRVLDVLEARVDLRNLLTKLRALELQLSPKIVEMSMVRFTRKSRFITEQIVSAGTRNEVLARLETTRYANLASRISRMYDESVDIYEVEIAIEDFIAQRVKLQLTAFPFHLGTVVGFFNLKFYEVRNIRSIAVGIERGEPADLIRKLITII